VKKNLITVDSSEEELQEIPYVEWSNDDYVEVSEKEIANITEESFAVGDVAREDFILVNLPRKGAFLVTQLK
jgi:hypothetical protein